MPIVAMPLDQTIDPIPVAKMAENAAKDHCQGDIFQTMSNGASTNKAACTESINAPIA